MEEGICEFCDKPTDHSNVLTHNETDVVYIACDDCAGKESTQELTGSVNDSEETDSEETQEDSEESEDAEDREEPKQAKKKKYA